MHEFYKRIISGAFFCTLLFYIFFYLPPAAFTLFLLALLAEILIFELPQLQKKLCKNFLLLPLLYPIVPFLCLISMNHHPQGHFLLPFLFITVWGNDMGAYCTGKLFGKHKLFPTISPGKTWEGFWGGFALCGAITAILLPLYTLSYSTGTVLLVSSTISVLATAGDLFESWLKRKAGIKDSGSIMPGHGGLLDRFDSILFVAIPFTIYCFFLPNLH